MDTVHPPLSRWVIGIPLYLSGLRYPVTSPAADSRNYNVVGNSVLYDSSDSRRTLALARIGVLPFFLLAVCVVFFWTRQEFGDFAGILAVALFTTCPVVLTFASIAYTDMAAGATQAASLFAFVAWLKERTTRSTILFGVSVGLASLTKFTAAIFLPAAGLGILGIKWLASRKMGETQKPSVVLLVRQLAIVLLIIATMLWGGYRFATGHVREALQIPAGSNPEFRKVPKPLRGLVLTLVRSNPVIPAPALVRGLATAWQYNHATPKSYLLSKMKRGGWWYFYPAAITFKSPVAFLVLALVGFFAAWRLASQRPWTASAPAVAVLAILASTTGVSVNLGVRHVMVVFLLLSIVAGQGCSYLWRARKQWYGAPAVCLLGLLTWQGVASFRARHDFIAYFNELAGRDPSRVLVQGCDLDCGQDLLRLSEALRTRHVSHLELAVWSSADMSRMGLPDFTIPQPYTPSHGWLAISMRSLRVGDVFHLEYPPGSFEWLSQYQPKEKVGRTIWLYYIP